MNDWLYIKFFNLYFSFDVFRLIQDSVREIDQRSECRLLAWKYKLYLFNLRGKISSEDKEYIIKFSRNLRADYNAQSK